MVFKSFNLRKMCFVIWFFWLFDYVLLSYGVGNVFWENILITWKCIIRKCGLFSKNWDKSWKIIKNNS